MRCSGPASLESWLILFQFRQSKNLDMEVITSGSLSAKLEIKNLRPLWLFGLFYWPQNILLWLKLSSSSLYVPLPSLGY